MSLPAIEVSGLGKRYVIQHEARHDSLRDTLHHTARKVWRRVRWGTGFETEEFWALRDLSFSIQPGEVVGIIGRNGAGKSTLLKVLSRITEPTTGRVALRGRVASLLEVGTGFHPDLTGRENVFLNGAILGMSRAEIRRKFDEIVAFAEVERFLDTPVKRYSSGMYVRLAFSVAAHLEPEILIVDEVLAVGDQAFQKKCLGRMQSLTREGGRTVLFVSHNLGAIRQLCSRCVWLQNGTLTQQGPTAALLDRYALEISGEDGRLKTAAERDPTLKAYVSGIRFEDSDGRTRTSLPLDQDWCIRVSVECRVAMTDFVVGLGIVTIDNIGLQTCWSPPAPVEPGRWEYCFHQHQVRLAAGNYGIRIGLSASGRSIQQGDLGRIELVAENLVEHFEATSGSGLVLNSMRVERQRL